MEAFNFTFYELEKRLGDKPFLLQPFGDEWETWTYQEAGQKARKLAAGLKALGLPEKSHIGLVSKNCREWLVADLAIVMAGYISVPFFPTLSGEQISEVLEIGDVSALFVGKIENWEDMKTGIPKGLPIIAFPHYKGNSKVDQGQKWETVLENNKPIDKVADLYMDDIWTIIFTSGTTGTPKGVVLDYRIFDAVRIPTETNNPIGIDLDGNNRMFSYLPLNHIAERVLVESGVFRYGGTVAFSESIESFAKNLADAKPTTFFGVPRIYTKFQQAILGKMPQKKLDRLLKIPIVSGIVKKKLKTALGLQHATKCVSGAAALPDALKEWYAKIGINITNAYGMTENCAICTLLADDVSKPGSVGKATAGVELKIDEVTNEIMMTGPYVMKGYYKNPEKTAKVIEDGWLRTGDQGHIDKDGYLFISGRVNDNFKTAKGEFIVPGPIEWKFATNQNIEQICVIGLGCEQPIALVNLSEAARALPVDQIKKSLETTRINANKELANFQRIDTVVVIDEPWTPENGMVTPTLKVKRNVLAKIYHDDLKTWESAKESVIKV